MRKLYSVSANYMYWLLRNRRKNKLDLEQEQKTIQDLEDDLKPSTQSETGVVEIVDDRYPSTSPKARDLEIAKEIMLRQLTVEKLEEQIEMADKFLEFSKKILSKEELMIIEGHHEGKKYEEIEETVNYASGSLNYRTHVIIKHVLTEIKKN